MSKPLPEFWYTAVDQFHPDDLEAWAKFIGFSELTQLTEVVSLDNMLCPFIINEFNEQDWAHNIHEHFHTHFFHDLGYLCQRVAELPNVNILAVVFEPEHDVSQIPLLNSGFESGRSIDRKFAFSGYDLIDEGSGVSAINNCGGFDKVFSNSEVSPLGLIENYVRAKEIQQQLVVYYPDEIHAYCNLWAIWRMVQEERDHVYPI